MNKKQRELYESGLYLAKTLDDENSVHKKKLSLDNADHVPDGIADSVSNHIKNLPYHELYGSLAQSSRMGKPHRKPQDVDLVVPNPKQTAQSLYMKYRKQGYIAKIESNSAFDSHKVRLYQNGNWVDSIDIHPACSHYTEFDVYGSSKYPTKNNGYNVQTMSDQLLRKANSVIGNNNKGKFGSAPHRELKDTFDFIATANYLLDSKQIQAEAELERAKKGKKKLKSWYNQLKQVDGYNPDEHKINWDAISDKKEQKFVNYAVKNPNVDVDDIRFTDDKVKKVKSKEVNPFDKITCPNKKGKPNPYSKKEPTPFTKDNNKPFTPANTDLTPFKDNKKDLTSFKDYSRNNPFK